MADHTESSWPGEREPSRYDVASANEVPDTEDLSAFKNALFSSPDATGCQTLMHLDLKAHQDTRAYAYPMALISDFPSLPPEERLIGMSHVFSLRCSKSPTYRWLSLPLAPQHPSPPHLRLAVACLADVLCSEDPGSDDEAARLFDAGLRLWIMMVEVDNRETRTLDTVRAAILLCIYGFLTSDRAAWNRSEVLLCCTATTARRMRLLDRMPLEDVSGFQASNKSNSHSGISSSFFVLDVIQSLHTTGPLSLSNQELTISMPASKHQFQDVYKELLQPGSAFSPSISPDDAVLLLFALLSENICLRRSLAGFLPPELTQMDPGAEGSIRNPYVPLAASTEYTRMDSRIGLALSRWATRFAPSVSSDSLALYHFCQLYRSCPDLTTLPRLAGYKPLSNDGPCSPRLDDQLDTISISEDTIRHAWLVLDHVTARVASTEIMSVMWLPIVLFYASLVLWARIRLGELRRERYGSLKLLLVFRLELEKMPWPCCKEMVTTLDSLMSR